MSDPEAPEESGLSELPPPSAYMEPTEFCPWCRETKPISEWLGPPDDEDENVAPVLGSGPIVCADCRVNAPPDADPTIEKLPMKQRVMLKALMGGATFYGAARAAGVSLSYPGNLLRGRDPKSDSRAIREAFQLLLEMEGLDIFSIARQTRVLFKAQKAMWNSEDKCWDWFPDNNTQLQALRHLTKLMNLDPPKEAAAPGASGPAVNVNIQTNLGAEGPGDPPGTFTINVAKEPTAEQIEAEADAG